MAATARSQNAMQRKYKKDLESGAADAGKDPIEFIRATCLSRGASGIRGIARAFQIIDDGGIGCSHVVVLMMRNHIQRAIYCRGVRICRWQQNPQLTGVHQWTEGFWNVRSDVD